MSDGSWRDLRPPFLVEPPYDRGPVEVMMSNSIVLEALYWWDDATLIDVIHKDGSTSGWLRAADLTAIPYPPVRWRPMTRRGR